MSEARGAVRSWIEVDEARLAANYRVVREAAGADINVLTVVKANAYGHGLERCAISLAHAGALARASALDRGKATWLGVNDAAEGIGARRALEAVGIGRDSVEILVMCGVMREEANAIAEHGLTPVVWTRQQVGWLAEAARRRADNDTGAMRVHVEIETGMGRQGVRPGDALEDLLRAMASAGLELDGICTHFSSAEVAGSARTREQKRRFEAAMAQIRQTIPTSQNRDVGHPNLKPRWVHAGSSSTVDVGGDAAWLDRLAKGVGAGAMVRCGLALYGYCLPAVCESSAKIDEEYAGPRIREKLKPVMTWKTRVLDVREVAVGEAIGYNATFTAKRAMRVALLPVGYADGLRRELSGTDERAGGWVMVRVANGEMQRAPIVGRVSMNLTTVDITGIGLTKTGGVSVGDEVVLLGDGITADDHARIAGTIAYEILCGIKA